MTRRGFEMTPLTAMRRLLLEVVKESGGQWDTRAIDYVFHSRAGSLEGSPLVELQLLGAAGLVVEVPVVRGTGPGWRLTPEGEAAIA
jgi:hypothetical protein